MRHRLALVFVVCLLPAAGGAGAQGGATDVDTWPESPAGGFAKRLLELINAGDRPGAEAFAREHFDAEAWEGFPPDAVADWLMTVKEANERLDFRAVRTYDDRPDPDGCVAILWSNKREQWMGMAVNVNPEGRIYGLVIMPAGAPESVTAAASPLTEEQLGRELDDYLQRMTAADEFSGSVLVARDGRVLFEKAYGEANRSDHVPNRVDTRFSLASMNKMFTAVAIAQLAEQGKLSFDDTLDRHLPDGWLDPALARRIRIEHLLTHTSGLGDYMEDDRFWKGSRLEFTEVEDYKPLIRDLKPAFEPGTSWAYSNAGFFLLGVIVKQVAGVSYDDYVVRHIYDPAGMPDTRFLEMDRPAERCAVGYYRDADADGEEQIHNNWFLRTVRGSAAGGGFSTVRDLLAFDRALRGGKLLRPASVERLFAPTEQSRKRMTYGRGFIVRDTEGDRRAGHGGTFPGVSTNLEMYLDRDFTVAVLCNLSSGVGAPGLTAKIDEYLDRLETPTSGR